MINKNNKYYSFILIILLMMIFIPNQVLASSFPTSITNIYELRDYDEVNKTCSLAGYTGPKRLVASGYTAQGYYLGTQTQFLPYKISAATISGSGSTATVTSVGYGLFCTMFGSNSPAQNSYSVKFNNVTAPSSCTKVNTWDDATSAGIAALINNTGVEKYVGSNLQKYYDTEIAINQFLYEKTNNKCHVDNSQCSVPIAGGSTNKISSYNANLVKLANDTYSAVKSLLEIGKLSVEYPSDKKLIYSNNNEAWISNSFIVKNIHKYTLNDPATPTVNRQNISSAKLKDSTGKEIANYAYVRTLSNANNANEFQYQVGVCNSNDNDIDECKKINNFEPLKPGNYTIEVVIGGSSSYKIAQDYSCGNGFQNVTPSITETKQLETEKFTATFNLTVEEEKGSIIINKLDTETKKGLKGATIKVVQKNGDFEGTYSLNTRSTKKIINLEFGTYEITETKAPSGYKKDSKTYTITIDKDSPVGEVDIYNEPVETSVSISKIDAESKRIIEGAKLQILDKDNNVKYEFITTDDEIVYTGLPLGKYYIVEIEAPKGYALNENKLEFEFTNEKRQVEVEFTNNKLIKVPNTLSNHSKLLIIFATLSILTGALMIYKNSFSEEQ